MICPKCGFEQPDGGTECGRCGIVFARYRGTPATGTPLAPVAPPPIQPGASAATLRPEMATVPIAVPEEAIFAPSPDPPPQQLYRDPPVAGAPARPAPSSFSPHLHRFEAGAALGETFRIYFANFLPFVLLTAVAQSPSLLYTYLTNPLCLPPRAFGPSLLIPILLNILCGPLATATVTFGVFQQMRGRDTSFVDCLKVGLRNLFPVLGVALLQGLLVGVGTMLCIVPGLIFSAMYAVSVPVAVEERRGVSASLERSKALTKGYRWQVFGLLFLLGILGIGAGLALGRLSTTLLAGAPGLAQLLLQVLGVVTHGISATAAAVMYYRLRSAQESIDVEDIASVFD